MCPRFEPLALLETDSHRFLVCDDGLHVEVRRPWIHAILKVADAPSSLPYGPAPTRFSLQLRRQSLIGGLRHFIRQARDAAPMEHAAWLTLDSTLDAPQRRMNYVEPAILSRGTAHITYQRPVVTPSCLPVVDCHSHGILPAFFSDTDDADDLSDDAKLAFVVGNLDRPAISVAMRFVGFGVSLDISDWIHGLLYAESMNPTANPAGQYDDHCEHTYPFRATPSPRY